MIVVCTSVFAMPIHHLNVVKRRLLCACRVQGEFLIAHTLLNLSVLWQTSSYLREIMITRGRYPLLALARNPQAAPALYTCVRDASMYFLL